MRLHLPPAQEAGRQEAVCQVACQAKGGRCSAPWAASEAEVQRQLGALPAADRALFNPLHLVLLALMTAWVVGLGALKSRQAALRLAVAAGGVGAAARWLRAGAYALQPAARRRHQGALSRRRGGSRWAGRLAPAAGLLLQLLFSGAQQQQLDWSTGWTPRATLPYPLICTAAGLIADMFGVGGGIVQGPLADAAAGCGGRRGAPALELLPACLPLVPCLVLQPS
jgi:hypothetical protein